MDRAVYAIFERESAAQSAMHALVGNGVPAGIIDVQLQRGELVVEDLPRTATASRAYVLIGVPLVMLAGAIAGGVLAGWPGVALGILTAAIYGTIAAAMSGSIDAKTEIASLAADVHDGRTLLVIDVTGTKRVAVGYERFLWRRGALRVSVA